MRAQLFEDARQSDQTDGTTAESAGHLNIKQKRCGTSQSLSSKKQKRRSRRPETSEHQEEIDNECRACSKDPRCKRQQRGRTAQAKSRPRREHRFDFASREGKVRIVMADADPASVHMITQMKKIERASCQKQPAYETLHYKLEWNVNIQRR